MKRKDKRLLKKTEIMLNKIEKNIETLKGGFDEMPRNILNKNKQEDEENTDQTPQASFSPKEVVVERVIDLQLLNEKLNYIIGAVHKIADAADVDLN